MATEDADFEQHFGLSISRIADDGGQGRAHRPARRRQHHHAAARAQSVPAGQLHARRRLRAARSSGRSARPSSRCSSNAASPSARSSPSTPTRCRCTAPTASRRARGCTSTSRRRTSRSTRPRPSRRSSRRRRASARSSTPSARWRAATTTSCRGWRRKASSRAQAAEEAAQKPLVLRGQVHAERVVRRLLRRGHPQDPRAAVRRRRALRDRPAGADDARRRSCSGPPSARWTAGCGASTSGAAATASRRRRSLPPRRTPETYTLAALVASRLRPATSFRRSSCRCRKRRPAARASASAPPSSTCRAPPSPGRGKTNAADLFAVGDVIEVAVGAVDKGQYTAADARAGAARRGRARRHRQPHRPDSRDGRRLRLRAQQVQPRHAGAPAGRLALQAGALLGRHRQRLHRRDRSSSTNPCRTSPARTSRRIGR